jgi:endonuclease YncB( thermonuclease family)
LFRGRRGAVLGILLFAALAVVAAWLDPPPPPLSGSARISDGDSFRVGDQRVRLLGLDAPELRQTCDTPEGSWSCGEAARDRLASLLHEGEVNCRPEDTDRYGRLLARCSVGEIDPAAQLVAEGLAIASGDYWREESEAKAAARGIWQGGFQLPRDWRDDHPRGQGLLGLSWPW